jgi:acetylornithine deacetylase/succinyl-diaminopimelate desuccinylase-like protein
MEAVFRYVDQHRDRFLGELFTLLQQPSISAQNVGVAECADLLKFQMEAIGISARILPTAGHPVVFGELKAPGATRTLLIYGHYDVQPPDPLELWRTPPFEPTIKDGRIWGRGTGDNKGQLFAHLKAVEAVLKVTGRLPVNVKFLFEGEEEISSRSLRGFIETNTSLLTADYAVCSDGPMLPNDQPTVLFGVRGILHVEVTLEGANKDVHSGNLGVFVPAPAWRLVHFLNTLKDAQGRILIKGFADDVLPPSPLEREMLRTIPFNPVVLTGLGLPLAPTEAGATYFERLMFQPTVNICGLTSGYQGPGSKTIVPHRASAKLDMRLVVNQDPDDIFEKFVAHAKAHGFEDLQIERQGGFYPSRTPLDHPLGAAAARAVRQGFGKEPILQPCMGGSDPDYYFTRVLGIPRVNVPYAPHDENNHAPNESIMVEGFFSGIKTTAALLHEVATL